ncbi:hypothetical protein BGX26_009906 [Mortierella sp. AD094]|nr:hypothetical protein BGX26_009906 [Mortierella sp. AD094]
MEETQSFRLIGTTDTVEINVNHVGGQKIVYWEDIKQVFPGVKHVQNGKVAINMLRDSNGTRIIPHLIKYFPDAVLDVVLSTNIEPIHANSPIATTSLVPAYSLTEAPTKPYRPGVIIDLFNPLSSSSTKISETNSIITPAESVPGLAIAAGPSNNLSPAKPRQSTLTRRTTTHIQSQLKSSGRPLNSAAITALINSKLAPLLTASAAVAIADESNFREYMLEKVDELTVTGGEIKNMIVEVLQNQKLMQDRLALIQQKAEAILVQNYELLEYTIPRLFIVLPETSTSWDPATMFRTKFRLHFICECGEHTKAPGSTIPHHLHLAKHEGYAINKPTEFFEKYGPFLMAMLQLIKMGTGIAGHVVPALVNLKVVDVLESTLSAVDSVTNKVIEVIDYSIKYLEENRTQTQKSNGVDIDGDAEALRDDLGSYLARVEGLEGVDLRQLGSYLEANSSNNVLGNLYRMTTDKGHVKWVCIDHYRLTYKERDQQEFANVVQVNGGSYEPQLGQVVVRLGSKIRAAEFFRALTKARRVDDLDITFDWACTRSDLEILENALKKSREFIKLFNFQPNTPSRLCKISFELATGLIGGKEFQRLAETLKTNSTLTTLDLRSNSIGGNGAQALFETLKTNSTLTTLDLRSNSIGDNGAQVLSEALKTNSTLTTLDLENSSIGDNGAQALSEALKTNSTLTTLDLQSNMIRDSGAQALHQVSQIARCRILR